MRLRYILPDEHVLLTQQVRELEEKFWETKKVKIPNDAAAEGRDAAELNANNENVAQLLERMRTRVNILENCAIFSDPIDTTAVRIWTMVRLRINCVETTLTIWWHETPIKPRIAYTAPLVQGILWWRVGDEGDIIMDKESFDVEVLSIEAYTPLQ